MGGDEGSTFFFLGEHVDHQAVPETERIYFKIFRPLAVRPRLWTSLLVYLHNASLAAVDADGLRRLGTSVPNYVGDEQPTGLRWSIPIFAPPVPRIFPPECFLPLTSRAYDANPWTRSKRVMS